MEAPRRPTQSEIENAREYIRSRIDVCEQVEDMLYDAFVEATDRIASIILKYKARGMTVRFRGSSACAREINNVIDWLRGEIDNLVDDHCTPEEDVGVDDEDRALVIEHIKGEDHGATFEERRDMYLDKFVAALVSCGADIDDLDIEEIEEIIDSAEDSIEKRLSILVKNTIAMGWAFSQLTNAIDKGALGFWVINGNNPCEFCRQMAGWHTIGDDVPCYHPNCQCVAVYL